LSTVVADFVEALHSTCQPYKQPRREGKANSAETKIYTNNLTRSSSFKLLFSFMASAIDFAPSSEIWLLDCIAHVTHDALRDKRNDD
jgi:hypothetical protein